MKKVVREFIALIVAAVAFVSPALAQQTSDTSLQLTFTSEQNVEAGAFLAVPDDYPGDGSEQLGVAFGIGLHQRTYSAVYYHGAPSATPFLGVLYGLTTLDPTKSVQDGSDIASLHLVLGVNSELATSIIGREFTAAFAGFTDSYTGGEVFPGFYPNGVTESDFINVLLYDNSLSQQYGRANFGTNLLFDFATYLATTGGALSGGRGIGLVAFSAGQGIGVGTVQAVPNEAPPPVPEPATWAMMILGFGVVGAASRYRRRATRVAFAA